MFKFLGEIFIPHPYLALIPALVFGFIYFKNKNKIILWATVAWVVYAIYEELNLLKITCSGECNIRIDLFLIYPVLIVLSILAIVKSFKNNNI
ncbi:MAG: hypothetical protein AB201_00605 [Parcubacteria bacterium C7867-006]|nr:MAG: hypothetical protein AB201_00605 [Parcubacteria bacterium C7867-006]